MRVLRTENSYSYSYSYSDLKVPINSTPPVSLEAEKAAQVSKIQFGQKIMEKESLKKMSEIEGVCIFRDQPVIIISTFLVYGVVRSRVLFTSFGHILYSNS